MSGMSNKPSGGLTGVIEIFRENKSYKVKPRIFKDFSCKYFGSCFEHID